MYEIFICQKKCNVNLSMIILTTSLTVTYLLSWNYFDRHTVSIHQADVIPWLTIWKNAELNFRVGWRLTTIWRTWWRWLSEKAIFTSIITTNFWPYPSRYPPTAWDIISYGGVLVQTNRSTRKCGIPRISNPEYKFTNRIITIATQW